MRRFDSTCALVTGGSRGIGAAVARRLAAEGATVTVTYRSNAAGARSVVAELTDAGHTAFALQGDVTDRPAMQAVVAEAAERMGRLDVLISNAGVEYSGPLASITEQDSRHYTHPRLRGLNLPAGTAIALHSALGRLADPDEVAAAIALLASPDAAYVSGSTMPVDGAWT